MTNENGNGRNALSAVISAAVLCLVVGICISICISIRDSKKKTADEPKTTAVFEESTEMTEISAQVTSETAAPETTLPKPETEISPSAETTAVSAVNGTVSTVKKKRFAVAGAVPKSSRALPEFFDDAVFIGDSVSEKLRLYEFKDHSLGKAQFLAAGSLGSGNALWKVSSKSVHPSYKGKKMRLEESVPLTGAKKIYIMLGMNDIAIYGTDKAVENLSNLIDLILKATPDARIFIQSMTPIASFSTSASKKGLNNKNIMIYNRKLSKLCRDNGYYFIDVASVMYDKTGCLKENYCSDLGHMGLHFNDAGCKAWVDYLATHIPEKEILLLAETTVSPTESQTKPETTAVPVSETAAPEETTTVPLSTEKAEKNTEKSTSESQKSDKKNKPNKQTEQTKKQKQ